MPIDAGNTRSLPRTRHSYTLSASSRVYFPHPQFSTSVLQFPAHTSAARQRTPQIHLHPMHYQRLTPTPPPAASKSYISCRRRLQGQFHPDMRTTLADKNPRGLSLAGNMSATSQPVDSGGRGVRGSEPYRCSWCCWEKQHLVDGFPSCIFGLTLSALCVVRSSRSCGLPCPR